MLAEGVLVGGHIDHHGNIVGRHAFDGAGIALRQHGLYVLERHGEAVMLRLDDCDRRAVGDGEPFGLAARKLEPLRDRLAGDPI